MPDAGLLPQPVPVVPDAGLLLPLVPVVPDAGPLLPLVPVAPDAGPLLPVPAPLAALLISQLAPTLETRCRRLPVEYHLPLVEVQ